MAVLWHHWGMVPDDPLHCERCNAMVGEMPEMDEPEYCKCCDEILCWACWADNHLWRITF